jgi:hypothetical protein
MQMTHREPNTDASSGHLMKDAERHPGPPLLPVALGHVGLFMAGVASVAAFAGGDRFPSPFEPEETILKFFADHPRPARVGGFFYFVSAIPLGVFTATVSSRLRFLGVRAAGESIALYGGIGASIAMAVTGIGSWTLGMVGPLPNSAAAVRSLSFLTFAAGGPGIAVFTGVLAAGVSVTSGFARLLPRWVVGLGLGVSLLSALSSIVLLVPRAILLVPAARFSGYAWLIAASALLPRSRQLSGVAAK